MCGIAGLLDATGPMHALQGMLGRLAHRGPDDLGTWLDDSGKLALGHRRLSIVDLSPAGHQPMVSASARYVVTYNGEIYNSPQLRRELELAGLAPAWRGHSDTEVLVAGFDVWGIDETLRRSNGMFALAVYDRARRELTLARDRMGEKPLYFGWLGHRFAFASELPALRVVPDWTPHMHEDAIASFLQAGYVRGPQSAIRGVFRLPAATRITLRIDELSTPHDWSWVSARLQPYWSLRETALTGLDYPFHGGAVTAADELELLLKDAVGMRMLADVPLGAFLSGGIDSSLVTSLMQAQSPRPVRTFCVGFAEREFDEAPHARAIARHLGTDHTELYVSAKDALGLVPTLAETFDEPFADQSQIPTLLLSSLARKHVTVALSGDGGDELFGGYGRYFAIERLSRGLGRLPSPLRHAAAPGLGLIGRALRPMGVLGGSARTLPYRLERLAERLTAGQPDALRLSFIAGGAAWRLLAEPRAPDLSHCVPPSHIQGTLHRLMFADQLDYLPDDILHKVDRATMASSLESRAPLLDHRVVEYAWKLPLQLKAHHGRGKLLLREILNRYVPPALVDRPKQGFSPPVSIWLRGPLREWAQSLLSVESLSELPMVDGRSVRKIWHSHLDGRIDAGQALWNVVMLADWRRHFGAVA